MEALAGERVHHGWMGNEFDGLVALVTGGASGLGAAVVRSLVAGGARVAVLDLHDGGHRADGVMQVACDVADARSVEAAVQSVVSAWGRLDIVVNNAGIGAVGDVVASNDDEWVRVFEVNVFGAARVSRAAIPYLRLSQHAVIVNTCSVVALVGLRERAVYAASKGALLSLTLAMAADCVADGIRVNAVAPGTADTPWVARLLQGADDPVQAEAALKARQPTGRLVSAEEVAHAIVMLASPRASALTGVVLPVDGGMTGLRV